MQSFEPTELIDPKQAKKRLRKRARLHRAQKRNDTALIRIILTVLIALTGYGLSYLDLLPGARQVKAVYNQAVTYSVQKFNDVSFGAGFQIQDISITGLKKLNEEEVLAVLGFGAGVSSLNYDSQKAWKRLQGLKWVKKADVQLLLPGTLYIKIEEYPPFARIQEFGQHYIVNEQGEVLRTYEAGGYRDLPLFVGYGALDHGVALYQVMQNYKTLLSRVQASIRVDNRRWDLLLDNGHKVMLPEKGIAQALRKLAGLEQKYLILDQKYSLIDLRLDNQLRLGMQEQKV